MLLITFVLLMLVRAASGQEQIPVLRTYHISCDSAQFAYILSHYWLDLYIPCVFTADSGVTLSAEIRIRGESSREYPKKSFKVNFPAPGRYENRDKLNLISEWTDPSFIREYLSYDLFRKAGLLAPKIVFTKLYINGRFLGLYSDVEQIDKIFLEHRGLDENAPIFKAADNKTLMLPGEIEAGLWENENGDSADFTALRQLIQWLQDVPEASFFDGLANRFDREKLARAIAVNSLIGNTSTYYHNYFLVRFRGEAGRWEYIPWDVDKTFIYRGLYSDPPYCRSGHQSVGTNELIRRCWLDPSMQQLILNQIVNITDSIFTPHYYQVLTDSLRNLLRNTVAADTAKQYTTNDFILSVEQIPNDVQGRGLKVAELANSLPRPFDTLPVTITSEGIQFRWTSAARSDTDYVTYQLQVSREIQFSAPEWGMEGLRTNHAVLTDLPAGRLYWRVIARDVQRRWLAPLKQFSIVDISEFDRHRIDMPQLITNVQRIRPGQGIYRATRDVVVELGGELQIERGVRIQFADSARLIVRGKLEIVDSAGDSVRFEPLDPLVGWGGVVMEDGSQADLSYLSIKGTISFDESLDFPAAITMESNSELKLNRSTVSVAGGYAIVKNAEVPSSLALDSCHFVGTDHAVYLVGGDPVLISNCQFVGAGGISSFDPAVPTPALISIQGPTKTAVIQNCKFSMGLVGISLFGSKTVNITSCFFEDLGHFAIERRFVEVGNISNSIMIRCYGGLFSQDENTSIWNCDFIKCNYGVGGALEFINVYNSVIWLTDPTRFGTSLFRGAYCLSDRPLPGVGNILGPPQLEKPWDGDFTPEPGSPLIDAGLSDGAPTTDHFGRQRLNTAGKKNVGVGRYQYYDIGAVEYPVGTTTPPAMNGKLVTIYPNPANHNAEIVFEIEIGGDVKVDLFDTSGRRLGRESFDRIEAGQYRLRVNEIWGGEELPAGVYVCRLSQLTGTTQIKMVVIR